MSSSTPQSEGTQFIVVFVLSISLMLVDHYTQLMTQVRSLLVTAVSPIEQIATAPIQIYHYITQDFSSLSTLKTKNTQLETENLLLKMQLQQLNHLKSEVDNLNRLLNAASKTGKTDTQIASITHYTHSLYAHTMTLNTGSTQGFKINQPVFNDQGILGKIKLTTLYSSVVLLITDADSQVPVRLQRTGQRGILNGTGTHELSLNFINTTRSVLIGDLIETSGLGNIYPSGYPIAIITQIHKEPGQPYYQITAKPIADPNNADKVLVLKPHKQRLNSTQGSQP